MIENSISKPCTKVPKLKQKEKKKISQKVLLKTSGDLKGITDTLKATNHSKGERIRAKNQKRKTRRKES